MIFSRRPVDRSSFHSRLTLALDSAASSPPPFHPFIAHKSDMFYLRSLPREILPRGSFPGARIDSRYPFFPLTGGRRARADIRVTFRPASHRPEAGTLSERQSRFYSVALIYDTFDRFCHSTTLEPAVSPESSPRIPTA